MSPVPYRMPRIVCWHHTVFDDLSWCRTRETPGNPVFETSLPWLGCQRFIRHHLWARELAAQSDRNKRGRMKCHLTTLGQKREWARTNLVQAYPMQCPGVAEVLDLMDFSERDGGFLRGEKIRERRGFKCRTLFLPEHETGGSREQVVSQREITSLLEWASCSCKRWLLRFLVAICTVKTISAILQ